jgi:hypothetical protein
VANSVQVLLNRPQGVLKVRTVKCLDGLIASLRCAYRWPRCSTLAAVHSGADPACRRRTAISLSLAVSSPPFARRQMRTECSPAAKRGAAHKAAPSYLLAIPSAVCPHMAGHLFHTSALRGASFLVLSSVRAMVSARSVRPSRSGPRPQGSPGPQLHHRKGCAPRWSDPRPLALRSAEGQPQVQCRQPTK